MRIEEIDKNFSTPTTITEPDIVFSNVKNKPFEIYGLIYSPDHNEPYARIPNEIAESVSQKVAALGSNTSGGRVRFSTDSQFIAVRAKYDKLHPSAKMPLIGALGFDLYVHCNGIDKHVKSFVPPADMFFDRRTEYESVVYLDNPTCELRSYTIHFPLYHNVKSLEVGIKSYATIEKGVKYINENPIVYYGSSITQGGCASHPGNSYTNIISEVTNTNHINLGFSGSARGETVMAEYIASLKMSAFVYDYDHNARTVEELEETHEPFFKIIREAHPSLPIICVTRPNPEYQEVHKSRREVIRKTFLNATEAGDKNVYFIDGEKFFSTKFKGCYTVDGLHPNDAGFICMANAIGKEVAKVLNIAWPY